MLPTVGVLSFSHQWETELSFLSSSLPNLFGCLLYFRNGVLNGLHAAGVVTGDDLVWKPSLQLFFQLCSLKSQDFHLSQVCCRPLNIAYTGPIRTIHQKFVQRFLGFNRSLLSSKKFPCDSVKTFPKTEKIYCVCHQRSLLGLELYRIFIKDYGNWIKNFLI